MALFVHQNHIASTPVRERERESEGESKLFPPSRSRQKQSGLQRSYTYLEELSNNVDSPQTIAPHSQARELTTPFVVPPTFEDVVWKFNRNFIKAKNSHFLGKPTGNDSKFLSKKDDSFNKILTKFSEQDNAQQFPKFSTNAFLNKNFNSVSMKDDNSKWPEKGTDKEIFNLLSENLKTSHDEYYLRDDIFATRIYENLVKNLFQNNIIDFNSKENIEENANKNIIKSNLTIRVSIFETFLFF